MTIACEKPKPRNRRSATTHALAVVAPNYGYIRDGIKTFEVRLDKRDYLVGDLLILQEHYYVRSGAKLAPTGETVERTIKYILRKAKGMMSGYIIIGLENENRD